MAFHEAWRRFEDWRIRQSLGGSWGADLLGGFLLVPIGIWMVARSTSGAECGAGQGQVFFGVLFVALGWSSFGRAFWSRLVARLAKQATPSD